MARTNWQYDDTVTEGDLNQIGAEINQNADNISSLAGSGRTTETVKGNADLIEGLADALTAHQAENAQQHADLQAEIDAINPTDPDNGRYQAEFGWDGASYDKTVLDGDQLSIGYTDGGLTPAITSGGGYTTLTSKCGIKIHTNVSLPAGIKVILFSTPSPTFSKIYVLDSSKNVLYTLPVSPTAGATILIPYNFLANTDYYIACDAAGSTYQCGASATSQTYPIANANLNIIGGLYAGSDYSTGYACCVAQIIQQVAATSGTVTKTLSASDLKKWGNAKWIQITPANTSVECDIIDDSTYVDPSVNAIPIMTSNTAPSGIASANSNDTLAYNAFDNNSFTGWNPTSGTTGWLRYKFASAKVINRYAITPQQAARAPKTWTFQGSNDGSDWTTLDTQTNITGWVDNTPRTPFSFSNTIAYLYYRLNVTANNGDASLMIAELAMYQPGSPVTLIKSNVTSIADLSDIDPATYPSLKIRWILSRNSISDDSPIVCDFSWTWEGSETPQVWEKIADVTLTSDYGQVDFQDLGLEDYKIIQLICILANTYTSSYTTSGALKINDISTGYRFDYREGGAAGARRTDVAYIDFPTSRLGNPDSEGLFCRIVFNFYKRPSSNICFDVDSSYYSSTVQPDWVIKNGRIINTTALDIEKISVSVPSYAIKAGSQFALIGVK